MTGTQTFESLQLLFYIGVILAIGIFAVYLYTRHQELKADKDNREAKRDDDI